MAANTASSAGLWTPLKGSKTTEESRFATEVVVLSDSARMKRERARLVHIASKKEQAAKSPLAPLTGFVGKPRNSRLTCRYTVILKCAEVHRSAFRKPLYFNIFHGIHFPHLE